MTDCQWSTVLKNLEDVRRLAQLIAKLAPIPSLIGLQGTLGAGKTTWTRMLVEAISQGRLAATSPTFQLVHRYPTDPPVYHVDAYRLKDDDEWWDLGVEEWMETPSLTVIEWADRVAKWLPQDRLTIVLECLDGDARCATIQSGGPRSFVWCQAIGRQWE
ncbi:MAG: tRNA (adenosine(37)-N6)-threonylcarbamoyltransferase complex ATPase subunit type 1 TsaE [Pirellulaceae bacterium]|jgi:tRNA threonylcarbamoyladenosine biosynthesis protein TsaE